MQTFLIHYAAKKLGAGFNKHIQTLPKEGCGILSGFIFVQLPVFEIILRNFIPHVDIPFYH